MKSAAAKQLLEIQKRAQELQENSINEVHAKTMVEVGDIMYAAPLESIPTNIPLPCAIFVKVAGRFTVLRRAGDLLSRERLESLFNKGATIYVHRTFWKLFLGVLEQHSDAASPTEKVLHMRHLLVAYSQDIDKKTKEPKKTLIDKMQGAAEEIAQTIRQGQAQGVHILRRSRDPQVYNVNHPVNVAAYAALIGNKLRMSSADLDALTVAALLHDIGHAAISKRLLLKETKLNPDEFYQLQAHTQAGAEMLQSYGMSIPIVQTALQHHERYDGSGYPGKLKAEDISLFARITAIADVYDALTSNRPEQDAIPWDKALQLMRSMKGAFDEKLLDNLDGHTQVIETD